MRRHGPFRFEGDKPLVTKIDTDETLGDAAPLGTSERCMMQVAYGVLHVLYALPCGSRLITRKTCWAANAWSKGGCNFIKVSPKKALFPSAALNPCRDGSLTLCSVGTTCFSALITGNDAVENGICPRSSDITLSSFLRSLIHEEMHATH